MIILTLKRRTLALLSLAVLVQSGPQLLLASEYPAKDRLIEKLSRILVQLPDEDPSKTAITLRLADLYAERGRLKAMKELEEGCVDCNAGQPDRTKAIGHYENSLTKVPETEVGRILTQLGHLYELLGQSTKAVETYKSVLKKSESAQAQAEAHLSLAELYFRQGLFQTALPHYQAVFQNEKASSRGLAAYRAAWCQFNSSNVEPAIQGLVTILETPELLNRSGAAGVVSLDQQFQAEVSRDLATFMAKKQSTNLEDAKLLYRLSPEQARIDNAAYLAKELNRVGQLKSAVDVWNFVLDKDDDPKRRLEGRVLLAHLHLNQDQAESGYEEFKKALQTWPAVQECQTAEACDELRTRLKNFVVDWHKAMGEKPAVEIYTAYKDFLAVFPDDLKMRIWAAQTAKTLKNYTDAFGDYQQSLEVALKQAPQESKDPAEGSAPSGEELKKAQSESAKTLDSILISQIEAAELSKDKKLLTGAYDNYIQYSPKQSQLLTVRYQKARLLYDGEQYNEAAEALKKVALSDETGSTKLKTQAADLAMDSLALLKDDARIESWAREFAKVFTQKAAEFKALERKSLFNQATRLAEASGEKAPEPVQLRKAMDVLEKVDLSKATDGEKIAYYKNQLILAEKLRDFSTARTAAEQLLQQKGLSAEDKEYALSRKTWLAEMVLDFATAFQATSEMKLKDLSEGQKALRLALLAELAGQDPKPFHEQYLKVAEKDDARALEIAAMLVRSSGQPLKTLNKYRSRLEAKPGILSTLYLEIYAKDRKPAVASQALKVPGVSETAAGRALHRTQFLGKYKDLKPKLAEHKIDFSSQRRLAGSLKQRVSLIENWERLAQEAIQSGDWTVQLLALSVMASESQRLYEEIVALPTPEGLTPEEQEQYLGLLSQQAGPYQVKAEDVSKKLEEFWGQEEALEQLAKSYEKSEGQVRSLIEEEIQLLAEVAPESQKQQLRQVMNSKPKMAKDPAAPTLAQVEEARKKVRRNPLNKEMVKSLLELERQGNNSAMVAYLESRYESLNKDDPQEVAQ